jgi:RHS repeat-associated protein
MRRRQPQTSNLVNKLTQVSMPRAGYTQTRSFVYNNDQRLASATNPENGTVNYNGDGTQARKTHPKGQWIGYGYDANGNVTATPDLGLSYDVENRLVGANQEHYGYGPGNQRVWKQWPDGHEEVYFWGPDGRKLGSYRPTESWTGNEQDPHIFVFQTTQNYLYFARQLVGESTAPQCTEREEGQCVYWMMPSVSGIALDRLGSVRARTRPWMQPPNNLLRSSYYPYGEERQTTEQDRDKFATYHRDSTTGLDYASQRYYSSLTGRFTTPDPVLTSNAVMLPQNWNRYAYVSGDPVNKTDPLGLCSPQDNPPCYSVTGTGQMPGGGSNGGGTGWMPSSGSVNGNGYTPDLMEVVQELPLVGADGGGNAGGVAWDLNERLLSAALSRALQALGLNQDCADLFGSGNVDPSAILIGLFSGQSYGRITFQYRSNPSWGIALTSPAGVIQMLRYAITGTASRVLITINTWTSGQQQQYWNEGNSTVNAETLLHELSHAINFLFGAGTSRLQHPDNAQAAWDMDELIYMTCFGMHNPNPRPIGP